MHDCAGIDVSKDHLDFARASDSRTERVLNTRTGVRTLVRALSKAPPRLVAIESTGGYERLALDALAQARIPVSLVNPWRVRRFGEGLGRLAKTDLIDARLLAIYAEKTAPAPTAVPGPEDRKLTMYTRRRRQLIAMIVAEKNRLEANDPWLRKQLLDVIRLLERRVAKIDLLIDGAIERDQAKARNRRILQSAPSVGPGISRTLLVDLPELGRLDRKQIASLCGLAPFARDSGRKRGQRSIRAGRPSPRTALYLGAMNAARFNPTLRPLYERLRAAGKPPKLAFIAVARKLLTILNAMIRDQRMWEERTA